MANLTYNYVYFASGPHTRQPRSSSGPGGFTLIQTFSGGTLSAGDTFVAGLSPATVQVGSETYGFAFVSVSGGTGGGVASTSSTTPAPSVPVGTADISVLVVYGPSGSGGNGNDYGATIDSFDITSGALFNDTFVAVTPDPSGSLTTSGNVEGWVPSATGPLTIAALSPTSPTGVDFQYWLNVGTDATSTSPGLSVGQNQSISALGFYKSPPVPVPPMLTPCQQAVKFLEQIIADGDRPRLLVAEYKALVTQLENCVREGQLTQAEVNALLAGYEGDLNPPGPPR